MCVCPEHRARAVTVVIACEGAFFQWYYGETFIGYCSNGDMHVDDPFKGDMNISFDGNLVIFQVGLTNVGTYRCRLVDAGESSFNTSLEVYGEPTRVQHFPSPSISICLTVNILI